MRYPSLEQLEGRGSYPGHYDQRSNLLLPPCHSVLRSLSMPGRKDFKQYYDDPACRSVSHRWRSPGPDFTPCDETVVELFLQEWRSLRSDYALYIEGRYV